MSLEPLLRGLFDYAGMFPPAALSFDDALRESAGFTTQLRRPGLVANDMVVTPDNLGKLTDEAVAAAGFERDCNICLVGVPLNAAEDHAAAIVAFNEEGRHATPKRRITSIEIHAESLDEAPEMLRRVRQNIGSVAMYFEPKWEDARMAQESRECINMLHGLRSDGAPIGFKVRCAGPTAVSPSTLASIIVGVNKARLPLKLTQGLHHPFAGDERYGNEHGFLNVAVALRLHHALALKQDDVEACLTDREPASFTWGQGLGWAGRVAMMQRIEEATSAVPFAIGSCSIAEPDEDLRELLA